MKVTIIFIIISLFVGLPAIAQQGPDMSFYIEEYNKSDTTVADMLDILRMVRDENLTGIGSFYNNAIRVYIQRLSNFTDPRYRLQVEEAARLILRGLGAEKHTESAPFIWSLIQYFDIAYNENDGYLMSEALISMGQAGGKSYATNIADILQRYNDSSSADTLVKSRIQIVAPAAIKALELLCESIGVKPVFFASVGWYDPWIKTEASNALVTMMETLGEVIGDIVSDIIRDHFNLPDIKLAAWQGLLRAQVANSVKSKVAVVAIESSYTFAATTRESQNILVMMRMSAIDTIRLMGVEDDHVYAFLERVYREAYNSPSTDFETIVQVVRTLTALKTDEAVELLTEFLRGLHTRKRSASSTVIDRNIMSIIIPALGSTGTQSRAVIQLLTVISSSSMYTQAEQTWARNALSALNASLR